MGASQSGQVAEDQEEEEEENDDEDSVHVVENGGRKEFREFGVDNQVEKKVLEQEPEMLPFHSSASPLSPQLSSFGTPRLGPSIKVWDPYNVLAAPPPPPPPPHFPRSFPNAIDCDDRWSSVTEFYLISHGECHMSLRPDLVCGRCPEAALTPNGKRQARALAVFLKSQGVRFNAVYASPLDRARATAVCVCQEMNFSEEQIQSSDALVEMSQGHWEGCHQSDIYTAEILSLMDRFQPDFSAPSGESLRQVEFRMVQFFNRMVSGLPEKLRSDISPSDQIENQVFTRHNSHTLADSIHAQEGPSFPLAKRHCQGFPRKKSGKSRLQFVSSTGDHEADDEMSPRETNHLGSLHKITVMSSSTCVSSTIGVFTHAIPIKCLMTGLLGCSTVMSHKICIESSSVTVLQHSWKMGWQIKRLNDTAHLRLL